MKSVCRVNIFTSFIIDCAGLSSSKIINSINQQQQQNETTLAITESKEKKPYSAAATDNQVKSGDD